LAGGSELLELVRALLEKEEGGREAERERGRGSGRAAAACDARRVPCSGGAVAKLVTMSTHRAKISGCYIFQVNFDLSFSQDLSEVVCSHFFLER